jgi:RNA polymerase sigma-70 factor (ECF subfamily)
MAAVGHDDRGALVTQLVGAARTAWPQLEIPPAVVEAHLGRLDPAAPPEPAHSADLALAAACAQGLPAALAVLERGPLREIGDFVARIDSSPAFAAEVRQLVREKLLVGTSPGQPGSIVRYGGRGPLGGWIRVVAARAAIDLRRARGQEPPDTADTDRVVALTLDPETSLLRERHREPFQAALSEALAALSARERNLLRLHFAEGCTLEQLATSYQVHRATVARWLATARAAVLSGVARRLGESAGMTEGEIGSVVRLLGSEIDVSLSRLR